MSELIDYFAHQYALVLDNNEGPQRDVQRIVQEYLVGEQVSLSQYRAMTSAERNENYASGIGEEVLDYIESEVLSLLDQPSSALLPYQLIMAGLMLNGSQLAWEMGKHYMPDPRDVDEYLHDDEEGQDED